MAISKLVQKAVKDSKLLSEKSKKELLEKAKKENPNRGK
jgi:ribonuclease HII